MKQLLLLCFTVATISVSAQKVNESKVPEAVKSVFNKAYSGAQGKWIKEDGNYEVSFDKDAKKMTLVITPAGTLVQTEYAITASELPKAAVAYLDANAKGVKIKEMAHILKPNGEVEFEAEVKGKDILFDKDGKFLSKEK
jgi:hypothetical protein